MKTIKRVSMMVCWILFLIGVFSLGTASAATKVKFVIDQDSVAKIPRLVAMQKGYFENEGLIMEYIYIPGGAKAAAAVIGGSADVTDMSPHLVIRANLKGADLVCFANVLNGWPFAYVISNEAAKERGITANMPLDQRLARMKGLKFNITSPGSGSDLFLRYILEKHGLKPDKDVFLVPLGEAEVALAAFTRKTVDVFGWVTPMPEMVAARGEGIILLSITGGDVPDLSNFMNANWFSRKEFVEKNPEICLKLTRALIRAIRYAHSNREGTIEVVMKAFPNLDRKTAEAGYAAVIHLIPMKPYSTQQGLDTNLNILFKDLTPAEKAKIKFDDLFTNKFVDQALKELGDK